MAEDLESPLPRLIHLHQRVTVCNIGAPLQTHTPPCAMDGECAFCGRASGATRLVYCEDCHAEHPACSGCAIEVTSTETEVYRLVA